MRWLTKQLTEFLGLRGIPHISCTSKEGETGLIYLNNTFKD